MKEITIVESLPCEKDICKKDNCAKCYTEHSRVEQVPENIEDIKTLLDNLKIVHKTFYTNEKDYKWTEKDKVKILRAIVIRLKLKDDGEFNENTITIDNENRISIEKFMFEGREFVDLQLSTTNQCWQIIKNLIGEE